MFTAGVDFSPIRRLIPGPTGFPPAQARPGARGLPGYSPLVELPNGVILDAPQIANHTGHADRVIRLDTHHATVASAESKGFAGGRVVYYASFDASDPIAATIEKATYAPNLNTAPTGARDGLIAFTNGHTGTHDPNRQGLAAAILTGSSPLNILQQVPPAR